MAVYVIPTVQNISSGTWNGAVSGFNEVISNVVNNKQPVTYTPIGISPNVGGADLRKAWNQWFNSEEKWTFESWDTVLAATFNLSNNSENYEYLKDGYYLGDIFLPGMGEAARISERLNKEFKEGWDLDSLLDESNAMSSLNSLMTDYESLTSPRKLPDKPSREIRLNFEELLFKRVRQFPHAPLRKGEKPLYKKKVGDSFVRLEEVDLEVNATVEPNNYLKILNLHNQLRDKRSSAIEYMLNSGADFINHMFDITIISNYKGKPSDLLDNENYNVDIIDDKVVKVSRNDAVDNNMVFQIRVGSVNVPQMETEVFDIKAGFEIIKKPKSKVKYERKAELKMLQDEPLLFMSLINIVSNNNRMTYNYTKASNNWTPYSAPRSIENLTIDNKHRIDIIIKHQRLLNNLYTRECEHLHRWANTYKHLNTGLFDLTSEEMPLWWFEDVKFLGQQDGISFTRDDSGPLDITFPFIFKRCSKIDRQFKSRYKYDYNKMRRFDNSIISSNGSDLYEIFELKSLFAEKAGIISSIDHFSDQKWLSI